MTRVALASSLFAIAFSIPGVTWAATPDFLADPLAAIDLNRNAIIADIVRGFESSVTDGGASAARLKAHLEKLRADRLLAASVAMSRESLYAIIAEGESSRSATSARAHAKDLGDANRDLLYTPIAPCRLVDTRGFGAPIQGGAFSPSTRRSYEPNGLCSLPTANVASLLLSITTQNLTPTSGGYLTILSPGSPVSVANDVFNLGAEWSSLATTVMTGSAGQFDVFVNQATAHVVVDIVGYFSSAQGNIILAASTATAGNILKQTAIGPLKFVHTLGVNSTAVGINASSFTTTGHSNSAFGFAALNGNSTGNFNTAVGSQALAGNLTGRQNTAVGGNALSSTGAASDNAAFGLLAASRTTAQNNTAIGTFSLSANTTGRDNIALGGGAGGSLTTGHSNIAIGNRGVAAEGHTIRIGSPYDGTSSVGQNRAFIAGVSGVTTGGAGTAVLIDSNGQLGTVSSSRRYKDDIAEMDAASNALMKLRPVTFHYKTDQNAAGRRLQYGLIAEEVGEVYPGLVAHSADGQIETVMYQYLPSMLLNEYQKQQRTIEAQARHIERMERTHTAEIAGLKQAVAEIADLKQQMAHMVRLLDQQRLGTVTAGLGLK